MDSSRPGSFPGFLKGTNAHFKASAKGAPKMNPRASKPAGVVSVSDIVLEMRFARSEICRISIEVSKLAEAWLYMNADPNNIAHLLWHQCLFLCTDPRSHQCCTERPERGRIMS